MKVVSNTSPIVNLAVVGHLQLLRDLYGKIAIPQAVYDEIVVAGAGQPGAAEVQDYDWIETHPVSGKALALSLQLDLDVGEAEAIALAVEMEAGLLLLDERRARAAASRLGLRVIGLLGVLVEAKHQGLISAVKPILDSLIEQAGFWVTRDLYNRVVRAAGEP